MQAQTKTPSQDKCKYAIKTQIEGSTIFLQHTSFRENLFWNKQNVNTEEREGMDHKGVHLIEGDQEKWD